jgi:hypothetical protein
MVSHNSSRLQILCSGIALCVVGMAMAQTAPPKIDWGQTDSVTNTPNAVPRANEKQMPQQMQQNYNSFRPSAQANTPAAAPGKRVAHAAHSAATIARLKAAGLNAADPALAAKHNARMQSATMAHKRSRVSSIKIASKTPQLLGTRDLTASKQSRANIFATNPAAAAGVGSLGGGVSSAKNASYVALYDVANKYEFNTDVWLSDHTYTARFTVPRPLAGKAPFPATVTYKSDCNVNSVMNASINDLDFAFAESFRRGGDQRVYYKLMLPTAGFDLGASPHNLQISMAGSLNGSFTVPAKSRIATATVTLDIDSAPPFIGPNNFGFDPSKAHLAAPAVTRIDPGTNLNGTTSGDDTLGFGVNLGAGWSVKSTKILSAHSGLDSPNNSEPENVFRGAAVVQQPAAGRLQTVVHWHYGVFESLSYTIQWILEGPGGQRPLMTMPPGGPCDS